jgi:hypothetical protein
MWHIWGGKRCIQYFGGGNLREGGQLEDLHKDGRIILKCIFKSWGGRHVLD